MSYPRQAIGHYFKKEWHTVDRWNDPEGTSPVLDLPKPKYRPTWVVEFKDVAGVRHTGKIWQAQTDGRQTWYSVRVEGENPYHVTEERILRRIDE